MEKRAIKQINTGPSRHWLKTFHSFEMRYLWGNRSSKTNDKWKPRDANDETRMLKKEVHLSNHTGNNYFIIFFFFSLRDYIRSGCCHTLEAVHYRLGNTL